MLTTLPPSCAVDMKFGNLKFLEPSGLLQACNWTALPFTLQNTRLLKMDSLLGCSHCYYIRSLRKQLLIVINIFCPYPSRPKITYCLSNTTDSNNIGSEETLA